MVNPNKTGIRIPTNVGGITRNFIQFIEDWKFRIIESQMIPIIGINMLARGKDKKLYTEFVPDFLFGGNSS